MNENENNNTLLAEPGPTRTRDPDEPYLYTQPHRERR